MCFVQLRFAKVETVEDMLWEDRVTNKAERSVCGTILELHRSRPGRECSVGKSWDRISSTKGEVRIITRVMQKQ